MKAVVNHLYSGNGEAVALTLTLAQRERGITPFSFWEKGGAGWPKAMRERRVSSHGEPNGNKKPIDGFPKSLERCCCGLTISLIQDLQLCEPCVHAALVEQLAR